MKLITIFILLISSSWGKDSLLSNYNQKSYLPLLEYEASVIEDDDKLQRAFRSLYKNSKWNTECYDKAHVWAKQMHANEDISSYKVFIFYTKKFQREYDVKWWFHVAPMVNFKSELMVLDKGFFKTPVSFDAWEISFLNQSDTKPPKDYRCKVIRNMDEFYSEENHKNELCNILVTSMYYWVPKDIEHSIEKKDWIRWEVQEATKGAFWLWKGYYYNLMSSR